MTLAEQIRQIVLSEELSAAEKLDRLHALIPTETFKIDSLSTVTPAQVRLLRDGLMVTDAMEKIRCADFLAKEANPKAAESERQMRRRDCSHRGCGYGRGGR
jgi:hypothetical protein